MDRKLIKRNTVLLAMAAVSSAMGGGGSWQNRGEDIARVVPPVQDQPPAEEPAGIFLIVEPAPVPKEKPPLKPAYGRPALIEIKDLADFETLPADRRKLIEIAVAVARDSPWLPYVYGLADPALGGFDCSGAMYFVMNKAGLNPPRSSAAQYAWLLEEKRLHVIPDDAATADHPSLKALLPGDLLFWASGRPAGDEGILNITHVAMYLGREKKDGRQIMINATDGRSYRGVRANGYGIYDFRVPVGESKAKLVGYGPPPGLSDAAKE